LLTFDTLLPLLNSVANVEVGLTAYLRSVIDAAIAADKFIIHARVHAYSENTQGFGLQLITVLFSSDRERHGIEMSRRIIMLTASEHLLSCDILHYM